MIKAAARTPVTVTQNLSRAITQLASVGVFCTVFSGATTFAGTREPMATLATFVIAADENPKDGDGATENIGGAAQDALKSEDTEAPPPEAPYPNAKTSEDEEPISEPAKPKGPIIESSKHVAPKTQQAPLTIQKAKSVDDDGNYYYERSGATDELPADQVRLPGKSADAPKKQLPPLKLPKPQTVHKNGDYFYTTERTKHTRTASVRFGLMTPPKITNPNDQAKFTDLYGSGNLSAVFLEYEFQLVRSVGDIGLSIETGFITKTGKGQFTDTGRTANAIPDEKFTFFIFPNMVNLIYRFRYAEEQVLVPFIKGGAGLYTFAETRDDGQKAKLGGAPAIAGGGGINLLMDWIDQDAIRRIDAEYGIAHMWIQFEAHQVLGLNPKYDVTATVLNAGLMAEF